MSKRFSSFLEKGVSNETGEKQLNRSNQPEFISVSTSLPKSHGDMLDRWLALETALSFFIRRGEPMVFEKLKKAVEDSSSKSFLFRHLGQMLTLWPGCYEVRRLVRSGENDPFANVSGRQQGEKYNSRIDLALDFGDDSIDNRYGKSEAESAETGKRRRFMTEAALMLRRAHIHEVILAHASSLPPSVEGEGDDIGVAVATLPDVAERASPLQLHADTQSAESGEDAAKATSTATTCLSDSSILGGDDDGETRGGSERARESALGGPSKRQALRHRVAARERVDSAADSAAGGATGRRTRRLAAALPAFVDCLHSYLVQRQAAVVPRAELVVGLAQSLPHPPPPQADVDALLGMAIDAAPNWARSLRIPNKRDAQPVEVEVVQFNGTVNYSEVRALARAAAAHV